MCFGWGFFGLMFNTGRWGGGLYFDAVRWKNRTGLAWKVFLGLFKMTMFGI